MAIITMSELERRYFDGGWNEERLMDFIGRSADSPGDIISGVDYYPIPGSDSLEKARYLISEWAKKRKVEPMNTKLVPGMGVKNATREQQEVIVAAANSAGMKMTGGVRNTNVHNCSIVYGDYQGVICLFYDSFPDFQPIPFPEFVKLILEWKNPVEVTVNGKPLSKDNARLAREVLEMIEKGE